MKHTNRNPDGTRADYPVSNAFDVHNPEGWQTVFRVFGNLLHDEIVAKLARPPRAKESYKNHII